MLIFKVHFIAMILTYVIAFLSPIKWFMLAIGFFVVADLITGIMAERKIGNKIESKKMFRTVPKFIAYAIGIIAAHAMELLFFPDFPAAKMVSGLVAFIELKSLDENLDKLIGHSLLSSIIDRMNPKKNQGKPNNGNDKGE